MLITLVAVEGVAIAVLTLLVAGLLRGYADVLKVLHDMGASLDPDAEVAEPPRRPAWSRGPAGGSGRVRAAHDLAGVGLDGTPTGVSVAGTEHDTVLAFLSSGCSTCQNFWGAFRQGVALPERTRLLVVVRDPAEESAARLLDLAAPDLPLLMSTQAWDDYEVPGSPHVVHVDGRSGQVVGEGAAGSWEQVLDLLGQARADQGRGAPARPDHRRVPADLPAPIRGSLAPAASPAPAPAGHGTGAGRTGDRDNAGRIDAELASAGIGPGHPSLRPGSGPRPDHPSRRPGPGLHADPRPDRPGPGPGLHAGLRPDHPSRPSVDIDPGR
ncbi:MAG TPA: hypothetical protein VGN54_06200 [Mycobacteriales bacterium]|nr:hypothetical protein [Mycobacteriales bacterium]